MLNWTTKLRDANWLRSFSTVMLRWKLILGIKVNSFLFLLNQNGNQRNLKIIKLGLKKFNFRSISNHILTDLHFRFVWFSIQLDHFHSQQIDLSTQSWTCFRWYKLKRNADSNEPITQLTVIMMKKSQSQNHTQNSMIVRYFQSCYQTINFLYWTLMQFTAVNSSYNWDHILIVFRVSAYVFLNTNAIK